MELVFTTIAVVGGMSFSLAVALLVEEVIFGKVLGLALRSAALRGKERALKPSPWNFGLAGRVDILRARVKGLTPEVRGPP